MMILLDTCNWGIEGVDELPPHYHYVAGLVEMPDGRKEWIGGAIGNDSGPVEQREFISMDLRWDKDQLTSFINSIRGERKAPLNIEYPKDEPVDILAARMGVRRAVVALMGHYDQDALNILDVGLDMFGKAVSDWWADNA